MTAWDRRSQWFLKTFKPQDCAHINERIDDRDGERVIVCTRCGKVTMRKALP